MLEPKVPLDLPVLSADTQWFVLQFTNGLNAQPTLTANGFSPDELADLLVNVGLSLRG